MPVFRQLVLPAALAWGTFGAMAAWVYRAGRAPFDDDVLRLLHRHARPALDGLALVLRDVGNTGPMIGAGVLAACLLLATRQRRAAALFVAGLGGSMLLTQLIKALATRPRPTLWISLRPEHSYSFPSGHSMDTAALAAALFFVLPRRWWWLFPVFSLAVGWSRSYLGVHFPSDVLAGWSAGAGWVLLVQLLAARLHPATTPLPPLPTSR